MVSGIRGTCVPKFVKDMKNIFIYNSNLIFFSDSVCFWIKEGLFKGKERFFSDSPRFLTSKGYRDTSLRNYFRI